MGMTRKTFCSSFTVGSVLIWLHGCGGGGSGGGGAAAGGSSCGASGNDIEANHGHALSIPKADLDSQTTKTYSITGTSDHAHSVTFSPAQLQVLKGGMAVTATTTSGGSGVYSAHVHSVTATVLSTCP